eukprot:CAMPEP_0183353332 /NCGR_PEP_ID=MMETSP0164_2-20130417/33195_1 /TAXON_ID=221442 /ORGANISM="Coccolithus pelagicus ssp braarudi, Strain PLY182g" /LENGTH=155 /DNA_ID=CAMNT_0025525991 /DNA_START=25 /DNA_END=492 /DNA_ORIENTATION=-
MPLERIALLFDVVIPDKRIVHYPAREVDSVPKLHCAPGARSIGLPPHSSVPAMPSLSPLNIRSVTKRGSGFIATASPIVKNSKLAVGSARAYPSLLKCGVAHGTGRIAAGAPVVRAMQRGMMVQPVLSQQQHSRDGVRLLGGSSTGTSSQSRLLC